MVNILETTAKDLMQTDFFKLDADNSLTYFIGKIRSWKEEEALVFEKKQFIGVISFKGLLRKRVDVSGVKVKSATMSFPKLSEEDSSLKIAELMYHSGARLLPVLHNDKVLGVVYCKKVIDLLKEIPQFRDFKAKDIASKKVIFLDLNEPIEKAINLMKEKRVRKIPVMEKEKFVGGLFLEDVLRKYYLHRVLQGTIFRQTAALDHTPEKISPLKTPIVNEFEKTVVTCSPQESLAKIINSFEPDKGIFVIENSQPVGLITAKNLLVLYSKLMEKPRNIRLVNLPPLDEIDKARINTAILSSYDKIKKIVGKLYPLVVHFKSYEKSAMRKKHVVSFRTTIGGKNFKVEKWNWNLSSAVQDASKSFLKTIKREFKDRK